MKKFSLVFFVTIYSCFCYSQEPYLDVLTAPAMVIYSEALTVQQEQTAVQLTALEVAQAWVGVQMTEANRIHNIIKDGMSEVNGTIVNGLQAVRIYQNLEKVATQMIILQEEVAESPEYAIFAYSAIQECISGSVGAYATISDILKGGDSNLMTSGDRKKLLYALELETSKLRILVGHITYSIQLAKRQGFWNAANPFNNFVIEDKALFNQIYQNYEGLD